MSIFFCRRAGSWMGIIRDSNWNPQSDLQAESRLQEVSTVQPCSNSSFQQASRHTPCAHSTSGRSLSPCQSFVRTGQFSRKDGKTFLEWMFLVGGLSHLKEKNTCFNGIIHFWGRNVSSFLKPMVISGGESWIQQLPKDWCHCDMFFEPSAVPRKSCLPQFCFFWG